jgi:hypothetical protein
VQDKMIFYTLAIMELVVSGFLFCSSPSYGWWNLFYIPLAIGSALMGVVFLKWALED